VTTCLPSRLSRVRIPRTGSLDSSLEGEAGQECLACPPGGFPGDSHLFAASRPGPTLPPPAGKPTAGSCWPSTKRRVHVSRDAGTPSVLRDGNPARFRLECRYTACANPTSDPACRLFPSLVQVPPVVGPRACATLVECRGDQQRTPDSPRHVPALADGSRGRGKDHAASRGQAIPLQGIGLLAFLCCHARRSHGGRPSKATGAPLHRHTQEGLPL
jgi:hypothetical protein